jgi:hypothetical protein
VALTEQLAFKEEECHEISTVSVPTQRRASASMASKTLREDTPALVVSVFSILIAHSNQLPPLYRQKLCSKFSVTAR